MQCLLLLKEKNRDDYIMEQVTKFIKEADTYYPAAVEGEQPGEVVAEVVYVAILKINT